MPENDGIVSDIGPFGLVPRALIEDAAVNDRDLRNWIVLATYADRSSGECWPSQESIAEMLGCSVDTVQRSQRRLAKAGWLDIEKRRGPGGTIVGNLYRVRFVPNRTSAVPVIEPGRTDAVPEVHRNRTQGAVSGSRTQGAVSIEQTTRTDQEIAPPSAVPSSRSSRNPLYDALVTALGIDYEHATEDQKRGLGVTTAQLRKAGATPESVKMWVRKWKRERPRWQLTHMVMRHHWADFPAPTLQEEMTAEMGTEWIPPYTDADFPQEGTG